VTKKILLLGICVCLIVSVFAGCGGQGGSGGGDDGYDGTIAITGKLFIEANLIAEIMAQLIEGRTNIRVVRELNLPSAVAFQAVVQGDADIYPGYLGTMLMNYLDQPVLPGTPPEEIYSRVREGLSEVFDIVLLGAPGFSNSFAVAVHRDFAAENGIVTKSDLAPFTPYMIFGGEHGFFGDRYDGFNAMSEVYGFNFREYAMMDVAIKYQSFTQGIMDSLIIYTTDPQLAAFEDLLVLEDDLNFFPSYDFHPIIRRDTLEQFPEIEKALSVMWGRITNEDMIRFNYLVYSGEMTIEQSASAFISEFGLLG